MSSVYFVSDIHIRDESEEKARIFLRFLRFLGRERQPVKLVLGGDIFDLWLGAHNHFREKFPSIIREIKSLVRSGHSVHYFEGNHDIHLKPFWEDELGVHVHADPEFLSLDALTVRFEHGDQMDPEDYGYRFLRWLLRTPVMRWLILHLPDGFVARVGRAASRASRGYTDRLRDEENIRRKIHAHVEYIYEERVFDVIVHGHVHLQDEYIFERDGRSILSFNLGSWDGGRTPILRWHQGHWTWMEGADIAEA